jgi:hypothetical protein
MTKQHFLHFRVTRLVSRQFPFPKSKLRSRLPVLATAVLMPEAPVDKDYPLSGSENKIRIAR